MSERQFPTLDEERLPPELSALEARLAGLAPRSADAALGETKRQAARLAPQKNNKKSRHELAETIVRAGEQEIVLSLRQYVRSARISSFLGGFVCGLPFGTFALIFALRYSDAFFERVHLEPFEAPRRAELEQTPPVWTPQNARIDAFFNRSSSAAVPASTFFSSENSASELNLSTQETTELN